MRKVFHILLGGRDGIKTEKKWGGLGHEDL